MRRTLSVFTFVAFMLGGAAFAGPEDNSLVIGASQEPTAFGGDFLDVLGNQAIKSELELYLFPELIGTDLNSESTAVMVTEVPTEENGRVRFSDIGDGQRRLEIDLTLRDDLTWSDGEALNTDDVQFYYDVGKFEGMPVLDPEYWERINLEVQDEQNMTVSFEPAFNTDLIGPPIFYAPEHVMRDTWEETKATAEGQEGEQLNETLTSFFTEFSTPNAINQGRMVYSGPFTATRWAPGSSVTMQRNPNFFIDPPGGSDSYVQSVEYVFFSDTNALEIGILGGSIDATSSVALTFDQGRSPQLAARSAGRFDIYFVPSPIWEHMEINKFTDVQKVSDLQLGDPRTRQALLHAIDRQGLVDALYEGLQPVSDTWINPNHPFYSDDVTSYEYDPERAAQLFEELGWTMQNGVLTRQVDGRSVPFELEFVTTAGNAIRERVQQFIADDLSQTGVRVNINNAPSSVVFGDEFFTRAYNGSWTGSFMFAWISTPVEKGDLYACEFIPTPENNFQGQNVGNWCNEEFEALRDQAIIEFDLDEAANIFAQMQEVWANELPTLPLYFRSTPLVTATGLVNYVSNTYVNLYGYPPAEPWLVGWEENGAQQVYDQADFALTLE